MSGTQFLGWAEEPRPQGDPLDPFYDVVPIPFYPDDLPVLTRTPADVYMQAEINKALAAARAERE